MLTGEEKKNTFILCVRYFHWMMLLCSDLLTDFPPTSMEGGSAHQLLPVGLRPQQGVQCDHGSVVAAAPRPPRQAETLVGLVPLGGAVRRGPNQRPHPVGDASLIQVPAGQTHHSDLMATNSLQSDPRKSLLGSLLTALKRALNCAKPRPLPRWLIPLPLVTEVVPVSLRLLHSVASSLDEHLGDGHSLVEKAQPPCSDRPALDGVRGEKGRRHGAQEAGGMRVGHPASFHGNCHQRQQLVRPRIPAKGD